MFTQITKKEFIETLSEKRNVLLGSFMSLDETRATKIMNTAYNYPRKITEVDQSYVRKCIKKQSNALQFSNKSWLYFTDLKNSKLLKHTNVIVSYKERYDNFDEKYVHDIMVYLVG